MLKFPAWPKWQGDCVYDRIRKRKPGGRTKPVILSFIAVATNLDDPTGNFRRFAALVGGGIRARGYLVAILGYIGRNDATTGVLRCSRDDLARTVLTDVTDAVSRTVGARVYDALIESGIAVEIAPEDVRELDPNDVAASPPSSGEASPPSSPPASPPSSGEVGRGDGGDSGAAPRGPTRDTRAVPRTARPRGPARDARAASNSTDPAGKLPGHPAGAEERRGEERTSDPPPPGQGESAGPAATDDERSDEHATDRPLRPRERERFGKVLDYAVQCGAAADRALAVDLRRRHREGQVSDAEIAAQLAGPLAWVTRERLARWTNNRPHDQAREHADQQADTAPAKAAPATRTCTRHGRTADADGRCDVCAKVATPAADSAAATAALEAMRATLGRRAERPHDAAPAATRPALSETERQTMRLAGDLAEIPETDPRHADAWGLIRETARDEDWNRRAAALLDPLAGFGGADAA